MRQRVEALRGQIEPRGQKAAGNDVDRDQHQAEADERGQGARPPRGEDIGWAERQRHVNPPSSGRSVRHWRPGTRR